MLRAKLAGRRALLMPGAANALSARIVADLGFEAVCLSGAGVTDMFLGRFFQVRRLGEVPDVPD